MENTPRKQLVRRRLLPACATLALIAAAAAPAAHATPPPTRQQLAEWNAPMEPFRIHGNTWYVGTRSLAAILVTSDYGHVLLNAGTAASADAIAANITKAGFKPADVKAILVSHAHFDTAGGAARLQKLTGAPLYARRPNDQVLRTGALTPDDPQHGMKTPVIPQAGLVWIVTDEQLLGVGSNRFKAIATPGHSPGGTSWTWESCEGSQCLKMAYADSMTLVGRDGYQFAGTADSKAQWQDSLRRIAALPCDILLTPRAEDSRLHERMAAKAGGDTAALIDPAACRRYAEDSRARLEAAATTTP
jgi:metallo-beta-lactamase class B